MELTPQDRSLTIVAGDDLDKLVGSHVRYDIFGPPEPGGRQVVHNDFVQFTVGGLPPGDYEVEQRIPTNDGPLITTKKVTIRGGATDADIFDPDDHTVADTVSYLETADDAERDRVIAAEADGKGRKGIVEWEPAE